MKFRGEKSQRQKEIRYLPAWGTSLWNNSLQQTLPPLNKEKPLLLLFL